MSAVQTAKEAQKKTTVDSGNVIGLFLSDAMGVQNLPSGGYKVHVNNHRCTLSGFLGLWTIQGVQTFESDCKDVCVCVCVCVCGVCVCLCVGGGTDREGQDC